MEVVDFMEAILDCKGRLACYADGKSGLVENSYKGNKISIVLGKGETFRIERQNIVTLLKRRNDNTFEVDSYKIE